MKFLPIRCPECGQTAKGVIEEIIGCAEFTVNENDEAEYTGHTEVWWDEQRTQKDSDGRVRLVCPVGHVWFAEETEEPVTLDEAGERKRTP